MKDLWTKALTPRRLAASVASLSLFSFGCGGSPTVPTASNQGPGACCEAAGTSSLASEVLEAMAATLQDEYRAEAIYDRVLLDHGEGTWPFANIVNAEQRHSAAVARLYANRSMGVPASRWNVDVVPRFGSVLEACTAGIDAERENVAIYDRFLKLALPADVERVFSSNRVASLQNHLPAFEACATALGSVGNVATTGQ